MSESPFNLAQVQQGSNNSDSSDISTGERFKDVAIYFLAGLAMMIGCVLLVYLIAISYDKFLCCCRRNQPNYILTPEELTERQNATSITRRAKLAGILPHEKIQILRHFFSQRATKYIVSEEQHQQRMERNEQKKKQEQKEKEETATAIIKKIESDTGDGDDTVVDCEAPLPSPTIASGKDNNNNKEEETTTNGDDHSSHDVELEELCTMEHNEGTCPICLQEYGTLFFLFGWLSCI